MTYTGSARGNYCLDRFGKRLKEAKDSRVVDGLKIVNEQKKSFAGNQISNRSLLLIIAKLFEPREARHLQYLIKKCRERSQAGGEWADARWRQLTIFSAERNDVIELMIAIRLNDSPGRKGCFACSADARQGSNIRSVISNSGENGTAQIFSEHKIVVVWRRNPIARLVDQEALIKDWLFG